MRSRRLLRRSVLWLALVGMGLLLVLLAAAQAQEEVTSSLRRYKDRESSTGYYEEYEAKPRRMRPFVGVPGVLRPSFPYSPKAAEIRIRTYLADSHRAVKFYQLRTCVECHADEARNSHTTRGNLTCRQCHGGEPIASIAHYYSPLNPVRRHAYVCSKCHEGSSESFATYVVHEPKPGALLTRKTFPSLFYTNWFMYLLIVGTLGFFVAHTVVWVSKEFYHVFTEKKRKPKDE
ncbi:MAG: hypothetical protein ACOZFS_02965 [Thermodesulfobacteriota bacterium]